MDRDEYYTTQEAARVLRISPQRVRQLVSEGKLEAERNNDQWSVSVRSVHERLEHHRHGRRGESAESPEPRQSIPELVEEVRDLARELGRLEGRIELTERAESTIREERDRLLEDLHRERGRSERLEAELKEAEAELKEANRPWWRKLFRG